MGESSREGLTVSKDEMIGWDLQTRLRQREGGVKIRQCQKQAGILSNESCACFWSPPSFFDMTAGFMSCCRLLFSRQQPAVPEQAGKFFLGVLKHMVLKSQPGPQKLQSFWSEACLAAPAPPVMPVHHRKSCLLLQLV